MKKVCLLLSIVILMLALPMPSVVAQGTQNPGYDPTWNPTDRLCPGGEIPDIETYYDANPRPQLSQNDWLAVSTPRGLKLVAKLANSDEFFLNINYCLTADIDMTGQTFTPIANVKNTKNYKSSMPSSFKGTFDGRGHRIDGLVVSGKIDTFQYVGLFGTLGSSAVVRSLILGQNCNFSCSETESYLCSGSIAGRMFEGAKIQNIYSEATVSGGFYSGGIVGRLDPVYRNSTGSPANEIMQITVTGAVSGTSFVGGMIGAVFGNVTLSRCRQSGNVHGTSNTACVGGLIGKAEEAFFYSNRTSEELYLKSYINLINCINLGNLSGGANLAGIVGFVKETTDGNMELNFNGCINQGYCPRVLVGVCETAKEAVFEQCLEASAGVRLHGVQFRTQGEGENTFTLRFIGSIGTLDYTEVGFLVTVEYDGGRIEKTLRCKTVFKSLQSDSQDPRYVQTFRGEEGYLYALLVEGVPKSLENVSFTVVPYAVSLGTGETVTGVGGKLNCQKGQAIPAWQ